jgi:hypothetical protein
LEPWANDTPVHVAMRVPCPQVPNDRGKQQREDHGKARASEMMPNATAPLERTTPRKLKKPAQTTANGAGSEWV